MGFQFSLLLQRLARCLLELGLLLGAQRLATEMERYIRDPALAHRTGRQAREWILRHFSAEAFTSRGFAAMRAAGLPVMDHPV